jgi:Cd2+/Zn2+-exporting ATPase/Cu+-exporting ATPase
MQAIPGVISAEILIAAKKAVIRFDSEKSTPEEILKAAGRTGYSVPNSPSKCPPSPLSGFTRRVLTLFGIVFGSVLFVVVVGEWLGLFKIAVNRVAWPVWVIVILTGGYPVFLNVLRAARQGRIISHTLMTVGMLAALAVGEWSAAVLVVFFMRVGEYVESFTAERARRAVRDLTALAPQTARVERNFREVAVPVAEVRVGETIIVRPGEKIPVDGIVTGGNAVIDQSTITGESMPVEAGQGARVFAATLISRGSLRIRTVHVGPDTTFGRVIRLVEEAEASRADVQRYADKFSAYFLPVVSLVAVLTYLLTRNPLATAAVLVVVCSCSIALATPLAMIASIGAGARRGLLIKGGKYLEMLNRAEVLLLDKTGTLTLGRPRITDIVPMDNIREDEVLAVAASAERYSEHPLAEAVRREAVTRKLSLSEPERFEADPGTGVRAWIEGRRVQVGNRRVITEAMRFPLADELETQGKSLLFVVREDKLIGVLAAADTMRQEVPDAVAKARTFGIQQIELLTGDNERTAASLAGKLGISYRANLLPEDKIAVVRDYQSQGRVVVMVGDGVNDAPALAQADVGIAMGAAGADVAMEAAHIVVMQDDWTLVPELFGIARRTMAVVKLNLFFTALYNLAGMSFAAAGLLPLTLAAALQSIPDLGILANSSRLLRRK